MLPHHAFLDELDDGSVFEIISSPCLSSSGALALNRAQIFWSFHDIEMPGTATLSTLQMEQVSSAMTS